MTRQGEVNMQRFDAPFPFARRSFLSRLGTGLAAVGAALGADTAAAMAQGSSEGRWQPARPPQDDWLDRMPGKHRTILDAVSGQGVGDALHFASNILTTSKSGYGLDSTDLAVVICLRHAATAFAFNDAMWAKYSAGMSARAKFTDPKSHGPAVVNVYNSTEYRGMLSNGSATFDALIKQGVHFAVCDQSTHGYADSLARDDGGEAEITYKKLTSNLIGNAHMVPSGIVAVGHAQERGFPYVYCG
jgi:intracellular sulfur oxidation DsrE/DsrF family protein